MSMFVPLRHNRSASVTKDSVGSFHPKTGEVIHNFETSRAGCTCLAVSAENLFVGQSDGVVSAFDCGSAQLMWSVSCSAAVTSCVVVSGHRRQLSSSCDPTAVEPAHKSTEFESHTSSISSQPQSLVGSVQGHAARREALECKVSEAVQQRQFGMAEQLQRQLDELDAASAESTQERLMKSSEQADVRTLADSGAIEAMKRVSQALEEAEYTACNEADGSGDEEVIYF